MRDTLVRRRVLVKGIGVRQSTKTSVATLTGLFAIFSLGVGVRAFAADAGLDESATSGKNQLEEIVVTAEKRAEKLRDVPIAASAFDQKSIDDLALTGIDSLSRVVPSLAFTNFGYESSISLRGLSTGYGLEPAVSVYIDDTPLDVRTDFYSGATLIDLFDLDHLEVLRGPQGTILGASSLGGAIRVVTAQPDPTRFSERWELGLADLADGQGADGSALSYVGKGAVNVPLSSTVALRMVVTYTADGGWIDRSLPTNFADIAPGEPITNRDENTVVSTGIRAALRWTPDETLAITPSFIYQNKGLDNVALYYPDAGLYVRPHLFTDGGSFHAMIDSVKVEKDFGLFTLTSDSSFLRKATNGVGDWAELGELYSEYLIGSSKIPIFPFQTVATYQQITQEIRATSANAGAWRWITGVYFNDTKETNPEFADSNIFQAKYGTSNFLYGESPTHDRQYAAYGAVTFAPIDMVELTAGLRAYQFRSSLSIIGSGIIDASPNVPETTTTASGVDPKATVMVKLTPSVNVYASAAEGFRAGGVNGSQTYASNLPNCTLTSAYRPTFGPDTVWNFEVGSKGSFLDGRVNANAAIFQLDWRGFQQQIPASCGTYTANVGDARTRGVELETSAQIVEHLSLHGSFSYDDATIQSMPAALLGAGIGDPGDHLIYVPRTKFSLGGEATAHVAGGWDGFFRPEWQYVGSQSTSYVPTSYDSTIPSYTNLNLTMGVRKGAMEISAYAHNVTNSAQLSYLFAPQLDGPYYVGNRPRTIGLTFRYSD